MAEGAVIMRLNGPVVEARSDAVFHVNEAVMVGDAGLLGEVLRISEDSVIIQVYEDTTGLRVGDHIKGSGRALAVQLGPGLLGGIFDGLLRPLTGLDTAYVHPGQRHDAPRYFDFEPRLSEGRMVQGGEVFGTVSAGGAVQRVLLPPGMRGQVREKIGRAHV